MKKSSFLVTLIFSILSLYSFGQFNMGGTPKADYVFASSMVTKTTMFSPKDKKTTTMRSKIMFSEDGNTMATKFLSSDNPDMAKMSQTMEAMVFDFEQKKMFTFMNNNGSKTFMGIGMKGDAFKEYVEKENAKITVTKTSETKTIAGYVCDGYQMDSNGEKMMIWVSRNKIPEMAKMAQKMGQGMMNTYGGSKNQSKNQMTFNAHPELVKIAAEGRMTMGYSAKGKNGEETSMELEEVKPKDKSTFSTSDYKSMLGGR